MIKHPIAGTSVFLLRPNNTFLMLRRAGSHGAGHWALPGGKIDAGETISEGAAREVLEEVGISVRPHDVRVGPVTNDHFPEQGKFFVNVFCSVLVRQDQEAQIMEPEKASEIGWFTFGTMPSPLFSPLLPFLGQPQRPPFAYRDTPPTTAY